MKLEVSVAEIVDVFKEIQQKPENLFEMIRLDMREVVGKYLTEMMKAELPRFFGKRALLPGLYAQRRWRSSC